MPDETSRRAALLQLEQDLVDHAGGYLRTALRTTETCSVCTAPLDVGGSRCRNCQGQHERWGDALADRCGFITYAVPTEQSGRLMRNYKASSPVPEAIQVVQSLLAVALQLHIDCPRALSARPVTHWGTVPSSHRGPRSGVHPLEVLVGQVARRPGMEITATDLPEVERGREVLPQRFVVTEKLDRSDHVLIVEDVWTRGANAQSAALGVRAAGAGHVSVLVVGRWLQPTYPPTQKVWESTIRESSYRAGICLWTGSGCPPGSTGMAG